MTRRAPCIQRRRRPKLFCPGCVLCWPDRRFRSAFRGRSDDRANGDGCRRNVRHCDLLDLSPQDTATVAGTIDLPGNVNVYSFQADKTETLTVRQFAAPGSRLDTFLIAFTDSGTEITENDDSDMALTDYRRVDLVIDRDSVIQLQLLPARPIISRRRVPGRARERTSWP